MAYAVEMVTINTKHTSSRNMEATLKGNHKTFDSPLVCVAMFQTFYVKKSGNHFWKETPVNMAFLSLYCYNMYWKQ